MTGNINHIQRFSVGDGPGIRTTVFFMGCPLHCPWCHNPETQPFSPVFMYHRSLCKNCGMCTTVCENGLHKITDGVHSYTRAGCTLCGKCTSVCPHNALEINGEQMSEHEIMKIICEDIDFYKASGGGVTLSGGEPLSQPDFCMELAKECHAKDIDVLIDTSAQAPLEVFEELIKYANKYYIDFKASNEDDYKNITGGSIAPVVKSITRLCELNADVTVRIPVIPGHNNNIKYMRKTTDILRSTGVKKVDLLPFHNLCREKYKALDIKFRYASTASLPKQELEPLLCAFNGFQVRITN